MPTDTGRSLRRLVSACGRAGLHLRRLASPKRFSWRASRRGTGNRSKRSNARPARAGLSAPRPPARVISWCKDASRALGKLVQRCIAGITRLKFRRQATRPELRSQPGRRHELPTRRRARRGKLPGSNISHVFEPGTYLGSRKRHYVVHAGATHGGVRRRPLIVVLHGCQQNHRDIEAITGFNKLADQHGFVVAYPFVTTYRGLRCSNCWGWWFDREIHGGAGEVEDLWQIVEEIKSRYRVADHRIHVTGLSSGAGMAVAMMVAHADKIASGSAVAGVPYSEWPEAVKGLPSIPTCNKPVDKVVEAMESEMGETRRMVPLQIVHSHNDETVNIRAAENLRDSWGQCFGVDTQRPYSERNGQVGGSTWVHARYRNGGSRSAIETLFLEGPGHGWYGGGAGRFSYPEAPDVAQLNWAFFKSHPLVS